MKAASMIPFFRRVPPSTFCLIAITAIGGYLRIKGLTFQSLWLDEIHTMLETKPEYPISEVIGYLKNIDPHPPFYFVLIHYWFQIFGYSDFNGRLLSAIAGTLTIPATYFLAKEIYSRSAGLICATFTAFNFYNINYSQETRDYIFAFLFTCLSFLYFVRALRKPSWSSGVPYVLSSSLLLYTHYFAFFVLASQVVCAGVGLFMEKAAKRQWMIFVALFVLIFILYIPWIPTVFALGKTKSFWIHKPANNFFVSYFWDYFGGDPFSVYTFAFLLLFFLSGTAWYSNRVASDSLLQDRYSSSVLILLTWTFVTYLIPYVKSLVSVPLLFNRYTIVTLPALLVAAAIAVDLMRRNLMKVYFVMLVVIFSVIHLFFYDQYYETRTKTQWRELSAFVVRNNANKIPLISDREWQLRYYFGLANYHPTYVSQDSLPNLNKVWVVSVHQGHPVTELNKEILAREFKSRRSFSGIGASANLYIRQKMTIILKSANRQKDGYYAMYDNGQLTSAPVHLKQGKYRLAVYGFGTSAQGEYPSVAVSVNGKVVNLFTLQGERDYTFALEQAEDADVVFALQFTNDASIDGEDRNVFIKFFDLQRIYPQRGAKRLREESTR